MTKNHPSGIKSLAFPRDENVIEPSIEKISIANEGTGGMVAGISGVRTQAFPI
jgi:hypothetical protein